VEEWRRGKEKKTELHCIGVAWHGQACLGRRGCGSRASDALHCVYVYLLVNTRLLERMGISS
jgi:hypothetical protein